MREPTAKSEVLIVDDTAANLDILSTLLTAAGYVARPVPSGELALVAARARPPDVILLDIMMPGMDGYETCAALKEDPALRDVPVLFLSAISDDEGKLEAFRAGAVDYVTKPFGAQEVLARVATHARMRRQDLALRRHNEELHSMVLEQADELSRARYAMVIAMTRLVELRDDDTGQHVDRISLFACCLAEKLREHTGAVTAQFIDSVRYASPLHDIGKVAIPDAILTKPGRLTPEEFTVMKAHTTIGDAALARVAEDYPGNLFVLTGRSVARSHHERWDGSGYPDGLAGESIPLAARIVALADVYDAVRSKRCYKEARPHSAACEAIIESAGTHLDPTLVEAFGLCSDEFERIYDEYAG